MELNRPADPLSPLVQEVVSAILEQGDVVTPIDVLVQLEILELDQVETWRRGGLPYLERGITKGLARVARILRLLREHSLAIGLSPVQAKYVSRGKGPRRPLRFSKRGDPQSETAYSTHFVRPRDREESLAGFSTKKLS